MSTVASGENVDAGRQCDDVIVVHSVDVPHHLSAGGVDPDIIERFAALDQNSTITWQQRQWTVGLDTGDATVVNSDDVRLGREVAQTVGLHGVGVGVLGVAVGELQCGLIAVVGGERLTVDDCALAVIDGAVDHKVVHHVARGLPAGHIAAVGDLLSRQRGDCAQIGHCQTTGV